MMPPISEEDASALVASEKSTRTADRARIAGIAAHIHDLERSIEMLRIEQNLLQKRLDSYIYPVLTVPNEIMAEIFVHFLPAYPFSPPLTRLFSPTLLTHVCHHWRDIAHATPALWRAISLDLAKPSRDEPDNNLLHPWMARSRSYPISFSIDGAYDCVNPASRCIGTLSSHRARWEYLELTWMDDDILPFLCDPMPSLRHLDVSFHDDCAPIILGDAPLLRSVKISVYTEFLILPWRQLTSLVLVSVFPVECTRILQQTKLLVHCKVSFSWSSVEEVQQPDIELPFLQSFILIQEDSIEPSYLYRLILPALRTLQIPYWDLGTDPINGLASFISKSGCTLRELRITGEQPVGATAAYRTAFSTIPKLSFPPFDTGVPGLVSGK